MSGPYSDFEEQNPYAAPESKPTPARPWLELDESRPAEVRYGHISDAFRIAGSRQLLWIAVIFLWLLLSNGLSLGATYTSEQIVDAIAAAGATPATIMLLELLSFVLLLAFQFAVGAFFFAGLFRAACKQVRGESFTVGDLFSGGDVLGASILAFVLIGVATLLGLVLFIIPGLIISGRLMLTFPLLVEGRLGAIDAMQRSWDAFRGQTFRAVVFHILAGLASALGLLLCGVGYLFTAPVYYIAIALVYRDFFLRKSGQHPIPGGPMVDSEIL